jgi:hypothetical protein
MNWSFQEVDGVKPLSWEAHQQTALAIGRSSDLFVPEAVSSGILNESMKQVRLVKLQLKRWEFFLRSQV